MITYEYKCSNCDNSVEIQQSIKDKPISLCPKCNQNTLERQMSGGLHASVRQEATTIGQLAERNTKKFGKDKVQELEKDNHKFPSDDHQKKMEKIISGGKERVDRYIQTGK